MLPPLLVFFLLQANTKLTTGSGNWIVPTVHGTSVADAMSICQSGFAALGKTDAGWYGKGIYFTTYALYTLTYMKLHDQPALIVSWVLPGTSILPPRPLHMVSSCPSLVVTSTLLVPPLSDGVRSLLSSY